jgi:hypothetical protein
MTFMQLQQSVLNNVRRHTAEYVQELPNIINDAQDQICQRQQYWFLEGWMQYSIDITKPNFWVINLPQGASYATLPDDIFGVWEVLWTGENNPLEYLPYPLAISQYYIPSADRNTSPPGQAEAYSETPDYTGIIIWPVPVRNMKVLIEWRAKSLPDWDGSSTSAHNVLTDQYYNVFQEWCIALSWRFYGMEERFVSRMKEAERVTARTIDRENLRKKWARIKMLPQRKGTEIPRRLQIAPFRTPPWSWSL